MYQRYDMYSSKPSKFSCTCWAVLQTESALPVWPSSVWGSCSSSASPSRPVSPSPAPLATPSPRLKYHRSSSLWEMTVLHPLRKFKSCHQYLYVIMRVKKVISAVHVHIFPLIIIFKKKKLKNKNSSDCWIFYFISSFCGDSAYCEQHVHVCNLPQVKQS